MLGLVVQLANGQQVKTSSETLKVTHQNKNGLVEFACDNGRKITVRQEMLVYWEQGSLAEGEVL